ncbi:hypothetical protein [Pyrodictium abyssi]|uniref:ATP-binding protein n=1 Tax=Pyrodictium abyssi TaxID=54256 RepID=A0ABM8IWL2_9CREN|nr:hypothetical protein PABY_08070 [Pyrodictium abyssi]
MLSTGVEIPRVEVREETGRDTRRFLRYVAPKPETVRRVPKLLRSTLVIAPMGFGKTSFVEAKLGEAVQYLLDVHGVDDDRIAYVYAQEVPLQVVLDAVADLPLQDYWYLYIFMDDVIAAEGMHGRRAMSQENVEQTKALVMVRHRLENLGFTGYTHIVWTAQVYTLVDISVRRTSVLKIFKDYPDEPSDLRVIGRMLGSAALQALDEISAMVTSDEPGQILRGLYTGVALMKRRKWLIRAYTRPEDIEEEVARRKAVLARVKRLHVGPQAAAEHATLKQQLGAALYLVKRLLPHIEIRPWNNQKYKLIVKNATLYVKRDMLEQLGLTPS